MLLRHNAIGNTSDWSPDCSQYLHGVLANAGESWVHCLAIAFQQRANKHAILVGWSSRGIIRRNVESYLRPQRLLYKQAPLAGE